MIDRIVRDISTQTFESKKDILEKLNYFRAISQKGLDLLSESHVVKLQKEFNDFLNINLAFFADTYPTRLFRLTNNKQLTGGKKLKLQKITDLMGPPGGISSMGRCNLQGESVFYAALDLKTAIWETQPKVGDYITVSEWKIKEGKKLFTHAIFHPEETNLSKESQVAFEAHLKAQQSIHPDLAAIFREIIKFLCEEFMKPVEGNKKLNYLFSSAVSSRFIQAAPDTNGFRIDSIIYPSTKLGHEVTNIAILNSIVLERLDLVSATIYDVMRTNYDLKTKTSDDLIGVSPLHTIAKEFDFTGNRIIYDLERELKDAIRLHETYGRKSDS